jgi:dihydroorotate dehydrogenase (NAD+) catalytic subunit
MAETPSGMLNSIGLQGPGIDAFLDNDLAWLAERGARAVVSIAAAASTTTPGWPRSCADGPAWRWSR